MEVRKKLESGARRTKSSTKSQKKRSGRDQGDNEETIRLNGKYAWETAKRVRDFIASHDELIHITTFVEYRKVMKRGMSVTKEAHNTERERKWTANEKSEERRTRTKRAKAPISQNIRGEMRKEEVSRRGEVKFGKGSGQEVEMHPHSKDNRKNNRAVKKRREV